MPIKRYIISNLSNRVFKYFPEAKYEKDIFVRNSDSIDIKRINSLQITNFRLIDSSSARGVTLNNKSSNFMKELKESGINCIIDLRREASKSSKYANNCYENGLEYFDFPLNKNMPIFNNITGTKLNTEERLKSNQIFLEKLPKFFEIMNKGRVYIACLLGLHRTDLAVTLNYLLNPKEPYAPPILSHMFLKNEANLTNKYIASVKRLLMNLSETDRVKIGMSENFGDVFNSRVAKLRMMNGNKLL